MSQGSRVTDWVIRIAFVVIAAIAVATVFGGDLGALLSPPAGGASQGPGAAPAAGEPAAR